MQKTIVIPKQLDGSRLDIALVNTDLGMSRRKIRRIIDVGGAYINNKRVRVASRTVHAGDKVRLEYQEEQVRKLKPTNFVLQAKDILFENEGLVVINKPPGLPSQATRDQSILHVVPVLERYYKSLDQQPPKLTLVHRLDKETSGALIVAKNTAVATFITDQFREKAVEKHYLAITFGIPQDDEFEVKCYLSPIQSKTGIVTKVRSGGKPSFTRFVCGAKNAKDKVSLIHCYPATGRSHQLRVHLELSGLPIVGDKKYGADRPKRLQDDLAKLSAEHQLLHCAGMTFRWQADAKPIKVVAEAPKNLLKFAQNAFPGAKLQ